MEHSTDDHITDENYHPLPGTPLRQLVDRYQKARGKLFALAYLLKLSRLEKNEAEVKKLEKEMYQAAKELAFEKAAELRDKIKKIRMLEIEIG